MSWLSKLFCPGLYTQISTLQAEIDDLKTNPDCSVFKTKIKYLEGEVERQKQKVIDANNSVVSTACEFESILEFRLFSQENKINEQEFISQTNDCDDFARLTQKAALNWRGGRIINCEYQQMGNTAHMLNTVVIGNKLYKFEPQTDRLWFFVNLD